MTARTRTCWCGRLLPDPAHSSLCSEHDGNHRSHGGFCGCLEPRPNTNGECQTCRQLVRMVKP